MINLSEVRAVTEAPKTEPLPNVVKLIKLDLGCGEHPTEGFIGVDQAECKAGVIVHNLFTFPWPFESDSIDEARASHFVEHIPNLLRLKWFGELWRVLKVGATCQIIVPAPDSHRAIQDPTHMWPPVCAEFFNYLNYGWRKANGLTHADYTTDANFTVYSLGVSYDPEVNLHNDTYRNFASKYYNNAITDLYIVIKKEAAVV